MSSHHIIREKQEPALLILEMASFDEELLGQLLEWSPTIIVSEEVYDHVYSLGIKIDVLLQQSTIAKETQEHVKILDIGESDVVKSTLDFLIDEEYPSVNIISKSFNSHDYTALLSKIDLVVFTKDKKIFPVKSGFTKWKAQGESITVFTDDVKLESVDGLNFVNNNQYQTIKDGFYRLTFANDFIFIGEEL